MYFNSYVFILFLLITFIIYWKVPKNFSHYILLAANLIFVASFGIYCLIWSIIISLIGFKCGIIINRKHDRQRKIFLFISVSIIVLLLAGLKYLPSYFSTFSRWLMPIGMSFYSFRNISYLVDVYKGMQCETDLINYSIYSLFFPSFSAGPIDRFKTLKSQILVRNEFDYDIVSSGSMLFLWGMIKKIVVAAHMNIYTDRVFNDIYSYSGATLFIVSLLYTVQIYCDFSGYSDMAIGVARMFGIKLERNFVNPYCSTSITEFWRRWHISLSTWLRDYIYIPLGGSRCNQIRSYLNILITFLVSGIWHGASFNFIIWGVVHGLIQVFEKMFKLKEPKKRVGKCFRIMMTLCMVNFLWVVFRLKSIDEIVYFYMHLFDGIGNIACYVKSAQQTLSIDLLSFVRLFIMSIMIFIYDILDEKNSLIEKIMSRTRIFRVAVCLICSYIMFMLLPVEEAVDYIYFQF